VNEDAALPGPDVLGRWFGDLALGDQTFARASRYGSRILHGVLTGALMGGPIGMIFHGTAIAYLEHATRFVAPVRLGDTLNTTWTVAELVPKPKHGAGIVALVASARNQHGVVVAEGNGKVLVRNRESGIG
jgi:acyl dehydratase